MKTATILFFGLLAAGCSNRAAAGEHVSCLLRDAVPAEWVVTSSVEPGQPPPDVVHRVGLQREGLARLEGDQRTGLGVGLDHRADAALDRLQPCPVDQGLGLPHRAA